MRRTGFPVAEVEEERGGVTAFKNERRGRESYRDFIEGDGGIVAVVGFEGEGLGEAAIAQ